MITLDRVRHKSERYGFPTMVLDISVKKDLQQNRDKIRSSIMTEQQQLVEKKVFLPVEAWKLLPEQLKKAIRSSIFMKGSSLRKVTF